MMYAKLIFKNAKRSGKDYLIYIVTMTLCVTLFYAFLSISSTHYHPTIGAEYNISLLAGGMKLAICGISLLLLFLMNSYPCIQGRCLIKNVYMHKSVDMMRKGTVER